MWKTLPATVSLIALNGIIFLSVDHLLPAGNVLALRLPLYFPLNDNFGIWQFVTHMFMHGSLSHLFLNMFGLYSFGAILERVWGAKRFLIFYFAAGIGAAVIYTAVHYVDFNRAMEQLRSSGLSVEEINQTLQNAQVSHVATDAQVKLLKKLYLTVNIPMVGASGAIYGILTAFGILFPNAKLSLIFLPVPVAAKFFIPALLLLDLFSGVTGFSIFGGGIAHFAHVGGALIGFLLMLLWRKDISVYPQQPSF
ncbi:rhomboid family intramembrane serine protease [Kiritimatiellaeota bacterium B1221]|nr:rhomboid family intramembrane serine protease [Kiritimatiellaeota bacterium B1221]